MSLGLLVSTLISQKEKKNENELVATKIKLDKYKQGAEAINRISSNAKLSLEAQLREGLKIASQYLDLPLGILSVLVEEKYEILDVYSVEEEIEIEPGMKFNVEETYCDITINSDDKVAINHFSESQYADHVCYNNFGLETYIGAIYLVGGQMRGTVNFSSTEPKEVPFDLYDLEFIELLSKWIGYTISQKETLEALDKEKDKAPVSEFGASIERSLSDSYQ